MQVLRIKLVVSLLLIIACQSKPTYRIDSYHYPRETLQVFAVNSDRVKQECIFLDAEGDNNWRHLYFMYILNDKNELIRIMASTDLEGEYCKEQISSIEKLLRAEPHAKICAHGEMSPYQPQNSESDYASFDTFQKHIVAYDDLTFDSLCNSKSCVGDNSAWVRTCPGFPKK